MGFLAMRGFPLGRKPSPFSGRDNLDFWAHDERYRTDFGGNLGDATDVFDGEQFTDFWAASTPASTPGVSVTRIRREGDQMVADLKLQDRRRAGPIAGVEVWKDRIEVAGDVTVLPGGQLDVRAGTQVLVGSDALAAGKDTARVELMVYGDLFVGVSGQGQTAFRSAAADPKPGDWQGLVLHPVASVYLRSVLIDHAHYGLWTERLDHAITLEDVTIRHVSADGIRLGKGRRGDSLRSRARRGSGWSGHLDRRSGLDADTPSRAAQQWPRWPLARRRGFCRCSTAVSTATARLRPRRPTWSWGEGPAAR